MVESWIDSCPLEGTCSECGLRWRWTEVFCPENYQPRWCIEFVKRWRRLPWAAVSTGVRSLWPWRFWSQLAMSQKIHWWRLAMYVIWWIVFPVLPVYVAAQAGVAVYVRYSLQQAVTASNQSSPAWLAQQQNALAGLQSQRLSRPLDPLLAHQISDTEFRVTLLQRRAASPTSISQSYGDAVFEAVFMPLADSSGGSFTGPAGMRPYVAPVQLWDKALEVTRSTGAYWSRSGTLDVAARGIIWGSAMMLLLPVSFVLLPASRRKAKVRWVHIGRVTLYGVPMVFLTMWIAGALWVAGRLMSNGSEEAFVLAALGGIPIMASIWWAVAIKRYLKMPHGAAIAVLMMILCFLVCVLIVAIFAGVYRFMFDW